MALQMSGVDAQRDEQVNVEMILAMSAAEYENPNNPDVDNMSYEQLMALGDRVGKVNTGCSHEQIESIFEFTYKKGRDVKGKEEGKPEKGWQTVWKLDQIS